MSETVPVFVYNFGEMAATGDVMVTAPEGWHVTFPTRVTVVPGERVQLPLGVECAGQPSDALGEITLTARMGAAGEPVLSLRLRNDGS